ncbi:UNVERIFIED_CONTAM: hypothetical protein FKN15_078075 [Acipenser sinensis]
MRDTKYIESKGFHTGIPIPESRIKNLACVFYNWEYMECTWQRPPYLNYNLFYWHSKLDHAMECSDYIQSNGVNIGCNFSSADLEDYTDFNICVNGSSAAGPLIPVYFRFELQNLVKPAVITEINVTKVGNERLHLEWKPPVGKIKSHCLEYEVQCREDESEWTRISTHNGCDAGSGDQPQCGLLSASA